MNELQTKAALDLEWRALLTGVADFAPGAPSHARIMGFAPADALPEARRRHRRTEAALEALETGAPLPSLGVPAVEDALEHLAKGGVLTGEELCEVGKVLTRAASLRVYTKEIREAHPFLAELLYVDPALEPPRQSLERCLDERGELRDGASSELKNARGRVRAARKDLLDTLGRLSQRFDDVLREQSYVERDGRYGLPVRSDAHRKVEGIVLGTSSTGATLYVEPPAVTAVSNRLRMAEGDVEREEARLYAELSGILRAVIDPLRTGYEACIEADVLAALCKYATVVRGRALPVVDEARIDLRRMRHPLLARQLDEVVANDILLESGEAMVISGPNAGGKTVALKCLGLAVWMSRCGIPVPALAGSEVGWFAAVLTDIGDNQSIERSLSTFSAEVETLAAMLSEADDRTLVLLDEVAGGTDPEEGAALAASVLEALVERGSAVAATTHYERLKELAASDDRFRNASVAFDFDEMRPTFRLTMGVPGASSALAVAGRFGLSARVIERARELLSDAAVEREAIVTQLERERRRAEQARVEAEADAAAATRLRTELEEERARVRDKERARIARESSELVAQIRQARTKLRTVSKTLDEQAPDLAEASRSIDEAAHLTAVGGPVDQATKTKPARPPSRYAVGDTVYVDKLGANAVIEEEPQDGAVRVRAGAFSLKVPLGQLRVAKGGAKKKAPKPERKAPKKKRPAAAVPDRVIRTTHNTLDLRGMRVEEALEELDRFVDRSVGGAGEDVGFVLHGHGTGALKKAVRDHLALADQVASRPAEQEEGGDAFTVFRVR